MTYVERPHRRPQCLDPIRIAAADFICKEKARTRTQTATLADRAGIRRKRLTGDLSALQQRENGIDRYGFEYLFRLVEALDHDVVISFVPRKNEVAA